jgi:CAAX prenyl protease-like protein
VGEKSKLADSKIPPMTSLRQQLQASPIRARVIPFAIFLALTFCQGESGGQRYWLYLAKTLVGVWMVWEMRPMVEEMRWAFSWEAVAVGVGVCVMWVGMDGWYPKLGEAGVPWNPKAQFAGNPGLAWLFISARLLGSTLVVPPLEEVFYRSFLYRYFVKTDFRAMPFTRFHGLSFCVTAILFGFEHHEWLAGILCGMAFQWLVIRKGRIGDAMTAHAITNFLLGLWVVGRPAWNFW